jgi:hypothetical protein
MVVCATAIDAGTKLLLSLLFLLFLFIANPVVDVLTDVACVVVPSTAVPCVNVVRYVFVCDNGDAVEIDSEFGAVLVGENVVGADLNVAVVSADVANLIGVIRSATFVSVNMVGCTAEAVIEISLIICVGGRSDDVGIRVVAVGVVFGAAAAVEVSSDDVLFLINVVE